MVIIPCFWVLTWYHSEALGTSLHWLSTEQLIENDGKECSVYSKKLIGSGGGVWREGVEFYTAIKWIRKKKDSEKGGRGRGRGWAGWKHGSGHPVQTHIKRQLKKASSWCGKFQIYNNRALLVIGSICAARELWEGEGRRDWKALQQALQTSLVSWF